MLVFLRKIACGHNVVLMLLLLQRNYSEFYSLPLKLRGLIFSFILERSDQKLSVRREIVGKVYHCNDRALKRCYCCRMTDFSTFETGFQGWDARSWGRVVYAQNSTLAGPLPAPPKLEKLNETNEVMEWL